MSAVTSIGRPRDKHEAATVLKVSERTVRRYVKAGLLHSSAPEGLPLRFTDDDLEAFFGAQDAPTAAVPAPRRNPKKYPTYA